MDQSGSMIINAYMSMPPMELQAVGEALELLEAVVHAADISNPCKP
jgi:hypothetical protein